jgi:hypothetical protein
MLNAKNNLLDYLKEMSVQSHEFSGQLFLSHLRVNNLLTIYRDEIKKINNREYGSAVILMNIQKQRNNKIIQCIIDLAKQLEPRGIHAVQMKGITLASRLYDPVETRLFSDIDLLVDIHDIPDLKGVLDQMGFKEIVKEDCFHHIQFVKEKENKKRSLIIEAHYKFTGAYDKINMKDIMKRTRQIELHGHPVHILDIHDEILSLFIHFARHYKNDFLDSYYNDALDIITVKLFNLLDIALLIDKNRDIINWEVLLSRIVEWEIANEMLLVLRIFSRIFKNRIPPDFIKQLESHFSSSRKTFQYEIFTRLAENAAYDVNLFSRYAKRQSILDYIHQAGRNMQKIPCPFTKDKAATDSEFSFSIKEYTHHGIKKTRTHVSSGVPPSSNRDCSMEGYFQWDPDNLYMKFSVIDDILVFHEEQIISGLWDRDEIELFFVLEEEIHQKSIMSKIVIIPRQESKGFRVSLLDQTEAFLDNSLFHYTFHITDSGYELTLSIPWPLIKIKPSVNRDILFDITLIDCDDPATGQKTKLSLFNSGLDSYYEILNYGRLHLEAPEK